MRNTTGLWKPFRKNPGNRDPLLSYFGQTTISKEECPLEGRASYIELPLASPPAIYLPGKVAKVFCSSQPTQTMPATRVMKKKIIGEYCGTTCSVSRVKTSCK